MEEIFENTIGAALLTGAIFIIAAAVVYLFPPKKINIFYGYRTAASMKSQERWDFAQKYGARQLAIGGVLMVLVSFTGKIVAVHEASQTVTGILITLAAVAYIFITTERAIKNRFNQ